ncbi:MAG TPA: molybdopterin-dependent oxidoreductase, partial [Candidatus Aquilonibacter sp.]|nr:molybdopterin-dependent oxidoreductase [Candidatus Aquilonibacter sp.]
GDPYAHNFTGNVTELCPVGALTSKTYRFKSRPWDLNRVQTSCTQCAVGCQQYVDTRSGNVLRAQMVESDDRVSDGWLCDRGRYNIGFYTSPERITQPLYRQPGGEFVQIGWDDAFAMWGKAIRDAQASGKGVGAIGGGRLLNEEAYLLGSVFRSLGVKNVDWRAGRQVTATPARPGTSYEQIENAAAILLIGETPQERAPIMWLRVVKAVTKNGAKLVRIASRDRAPNIAHTDVASVDEAVKLLPDNGQVVVIWDGVDVSLGGAVREAMASRGGIGFIASEQPNARGAEAMGMLPDDGGMDTYAMFDAAARGEMGVLSLFGVNPVRNGIDTAAIRDALGATPFVVVSELFLTETAQLATLVLPARAGFEKTGTTIDIAGDLLPVNASLEGPAGTLSDLEMLVGLAQQLDLPLPTIEELQQTVLKKTAQQGGAPLRPFARAATDGDNDTGRPARSIWDGGGTSAHDERIAALRADRIVPTELVEA